MVTHTAVTDSFLWARHQLRSFGRDVLPSLLAQLDVGNTTESSESPSQCTPSLAVLTASPGNKHWTQRTAALKEHHNYKGRMWEKRPCGLLYPGVLGFSRGNLHSLGPAQCPFLTSRFVCAAVWSREAFKDDRMERRLICYFSPLESAFALKQNFWVITKFKSIKTIYFVANDFRLL